MRLWWAGVISQFGDWFNLVALSALVSSVSGGSGQAIAWLLVARSLPAMLVSPYAGVLVDRLDRKKLLMLSDALRAVIGLTYFFVRSEDQLWIVYLAVIGQFMLASLFEPAKSAFIPHMVQSDNLLRANTLNNATWSVMLAIGGSLGGLVTSAFGLTTALFIDTLSFGVSAALIASIRNTTGEASAQAEVPSDDASNTSFLAGAQYMIQHPVILSAVFVKFGLSLGSIDGIMIAYARHVFPLDDGGSLSQGLLYGAFGLGAVLGPALLNRYNTGQVRSMQWLLTISFVLVTVGWVLIAFSGNIFFLFAAMTIRAMGGSAAWTFSSTVIQLSTADRYMGRVFSMDWLLYYLATTISTIITGYVLDATGNQRVAEITLVTALISLIPLTAWFMVTRWLERHTVAVTPQTDSLG